MKLERSFFHCCNPLELISQFGGFKVYYESELMIEGPSHEILYFEPFFQVMRSLSCFEF